MNWSYYAPCIVYGFNEEIQEKVLSYKFLEKYSLERYAQYVNKGVCHDFIYGIYCTSIEDMILVDKRTVDKAFDIVSKYGKFTPPKFILALHGNIIVSEQLEYNPESS